MMPKNVLGIVYSNSYDTCLEALTARRTMGSVPFGGRYRLIDFPLSNMVNCGITKVGVIANSNFRSLMDHIGSGRPWDLSRKVDGLTMLPPFTPTAADSSNRIDALARIMDFISHSKQEYVLLMDSNFVCNMDLSKLFDFTAVVPVSAKDGDGMEALKEELVKLSVPSEFFFPEDTLTDQPERVLAAEMIREKLLHRLNEEIPHGIAVSIEKMREREDKPILDIEAIIYCERESHKGIIIGKKGAMLKEISSNARCELERFFECKVNLQCWVKVKEDWRNREGLIHNFGLD